MSIVPGRDVPEVPQAWVDAVNKAVNDANHEDLCSSLHTLAECHNYKPGQWDIGVDLTIAVGVLEPLIRERVEAQVRELQSRIAAARTEIARQDLAAQITPHDAAIVGDALAAVETHLVDPQYRPSRGWLLWAPDGTLASVIESEQPVTRAHLQQRITADRDMPAGCLEPVPDAALPKVRAAWQRAADQGQHITPDDLKGLLS